ncbi:MAG: hypothetical protein HYT43_01720 [Candidatus Taylorbacteria bacterium]|nr:hypothetical protein [Candidatus Taylorbacteria bacterium]
MKILYPYVAPGRIYLYVAGNNPFMGEAREFALFHSLDDFQKTGSLVVKDGAVLGRGANGNDYHRKHQCERVRLKIPTGERYDLCEGCHPKNHSEPKAIAEAQSKGYGLAGADLYLWGHWWCCEPCWRAIIAAGIKNVYLLEGSERLFNKIHPDNILGKF